MINKKQLSLLVLFGAMLMNSAKAQLNIGVDAGITYNQLQFKSNNPDLKLSKRTGYLVNINVSKQLSKWMTIEATPGIIQKNYTVQNKHNIYQDINNTYLHLPLDIKYEISLLKPLKLSAALGIYYAYWLESNISGIAPNVFNIANNAEGDALIQLENIKSNYKFNDTQDNRSEFGWLAKVGLSYRILKNVSCSLKGHYYQSISDQQKQSNEFQSPKYNQTFATTIGLAYDLK